jgi:hypothetical protein
VTVNRHFANERTLALDFGLFNSLFNPVPFLPLHLEAENYFLL